MPTKNDVKEFGSTLHISCIIRRINGDANGEL